jgi:hypothetical protein
MMVREEEEEEEGRHLRRASGLVSKVVTWRTSRWIALTIHSL